MHRMTPLYSEAFRNFLEHTDEKEVLLDGISKRVHKLKTSSFLDIGAGNGDLSIPLSKLVSRYVALEQKDDYANRLRDAGLEVVHASWPHTLAEQFDAVLISHALPSHSAGREGWEPFVSAAWSQVNQQGHLLIVTFEDEDSEWNDLIQISGLEVVKPRETRLRPLKDYLETLGAVEQEVVTTHVRTKVLDEMLHALAFVWSDGKAEHMEAFLQSQKITKQIQERFKKGDEYVFPFKHYLLDTHR